MARMLLTASAHRIEAASLKDTRLRRMAGNLKVVVGLIAIYGPIALVLTLHRAPLAKAYFVFSIWAVEGILWYLLDSGVLAKRRNSSGARGRSEHR